MVTPWNGWRVLQEEEEQRNRKRSSLQKSASGQVDEEWVPLTDWLLKGVHKYKEPVTDADLLMFVQEGEKETPPPPETFYTNQQARAEVNSILSRQGLTHQRLDEMIEEYRQAMEQGIISAAEWEKYAAQLEEIRTLHVANLEKMVQWFMKEYYRVFDETIHVVAKIKLTGKRVWSVDREKEFASVLALPVQPLQKRHIR